MRPNLQLALDVTRFDQAMALCEKTSSWVDWIEVGTPLVISEGLRTVRSIKNAFAQKTVLVDVKIADAAKLLATEAARAGADIFTVLSAASDKTITTCVEVAHDLSRKVLGDHIASQTSLDACRRLEDLGVDYIGVHIPKDSAGNLPLSELENLLKHLNTPVVLAGGITKQRLELMKGLPIHTLVIGGAIINSPSPDEEARALAAILADW